MNPTPWDFLDAETLAICERFSLWLRQGGGLPLGGRPLPGGQAGGIDFEGFDEYVPGRDLRHLDWRVYQRTLTFQVRSFVEEGRGVLAVVLDASGSMGVGAKWNTGQRLAAALCYVGLREVHDLLLAVARGPRLDALPVRGGVSFAPVAFDFLAKQSCGGGTDLAAALGGLPHGMRGDAVVIGDFLDPRGAGVGVEALCRSGWRAHLIRISEPGEFDLPEAGVALHDPEGFEHRPVPGDEAARTALDRIIAEHRAELPKAARRWQATLAEVSTERRLTESLTRVFRQMSVAR